MRSLAEKLEITPTALYRYYPDRKALEVALAWRSLERLSEALEWAGQGLPGEKALAAVVRAYVEFAESRPAQYHLLMGSTELNDKPKSESNPRLWSLLARLIGEINPNADVAGTVTAAWSLVHGYVSLCQSGLLPSEGFEKRLNRERLRRQRAAQGLE